MVQKHHLGTLGLIAFALPAMAGDPDRGIELVRASDKGNCSICHVIPGVGLPEEAEGNLGPSLAGVGARMTSTELTERITDPKKLNPDTMMPAFGTTAGLIDVAAKYRGKPILTTDEIADVVAYLQTLK